MLRKISKFQRVAGLKNALFLILLFIFFGGCNPRQKNMARRQIEPLRPGRIVVLGFYAAVLPGQAPRMIRDPLSGGVFISEPVSSKTVSLMNDMLLSRLAEKTSYDFVRPGEARGVIADLAKDDKILSDAAINVVREVGRKLDAEAVIVGHIYRWRERHGGKYAAQSPASVAFDLHLVRVADGEVIWNGRFDKEQRSLSENVLDYRTFFGGKGKWMTAKELASYGLNEMIKYIPLIKETGVEVESDSNSSH